MRTTCAAFIACGLAAWPSGGPVLAQDPPQRPVFRASTELVLIETQVVARDGQPIQGLAPTAFEVFIDGRRRPVVSADFLRATELPSAAAAATAMSRPSNSGAPEGRIIVLAIDQASFPVSGQAAAREAATRVVDRVAPGDFLGMIAFPGTIEISPTREHQLVRAAIPGIGGVRVDPPSTRFNLSVSEAAALKGRDSAATKEITTRECLTDSRNPVCPQQVIQDGGMIADAIEHQAVTSISGLHGVIDAVAPLAGRKTLIVISAGLPMSNRMNSRPNLDAETDRLARRAAAANVNLYVFYMNVHFLRYFSAAYGKRNNSIYEDITLFGYGLERFADSAGGAFFQVDVGPDSLVDRVLRETAASYLLTVRAEPAEHDGKEHFIRVTVNARGATVRYRRIVTIPRRGDTSAIHVTRRLELPAQLGARQVAVISGRPIRSFGGRAARSLSRRTALAT